MDKHQRRTLFQILIVVLIVGGFALAYRAIRQDHMTAAQEAVAAAAYTEDLRLNTAAAPVELKVQLAITPKDQERGLMYRQQLGANEGMLFVFPDVANRSFWMKNTVIPLDLIFMDAGRQVLHVAANAAPRDESLILSQLPAKYVLEVPGGQAAKWGLKDGDRGEGIAFDHGDTLAAPQPSTLSSKPVDENGQPVADRKAKGRH